MYYKLLEIGSSIEVGRFRHEGRAVSEAEKLAGAPLHWSTDKTTLLTRNGIAVFKVVKVGFKFGKNWPGVGRMSTMAGEVRGCDLKALAASIQWIHAKGDDPDRRDAYLLEVERQVHNAEDMEAHVGLTPDQWAQALGITHRHSDCEGLQDFNHAFERSGVLHGAIKMLDCNGGGSPPTTDEFLDRQRSGEWYPRSCK